jgi:hypothetical protein
MDALTTSQQVRLAVALQLAQLPDIQMLSVRQLEAAVSMWESIVLDPDRIRRLPDADAAK